MIQKPLDTKVRDSLRKHKGNWIEIAREANVSHSWIGKFVAGNIPNPGYKTLLALKEYLDDKKVRK